MYMKMAKEQEMERQTRRHKKAVKQRTSKSGGKRRKQGTAAVYEDAEDDIPVMHVVSTTIDVPEVMMYSLSLDLHWIEQCFTSSPTQYRLYGRRYLQVKTPNRQYQHTEGESCKGKQHKETQRKHKIHICIDTHDKVDKYSVQL